MAKREYLLRITLSSEEETEAKKAAATLGTSLASLARMALFNFIRTADGKPKFPQ
jgi:hypothetical protein